MPRLIYRPANEDAPRPVFEDDAPPALRLVRADRLTVCPQAEDDTPTLGLALDEEGTVSVTRVFPVTYAAPRYADEDTGILGLALDEQEQRNFQSYAPPTLIRSIPLDDDLPVTAAATLASEDDGGTLPRAPWVMPLSRQAPPEDDAPVLYGAFEEDSWRVPGAQSPVDVALLRPTPPDAEDVPSLPGIFEDDRFVLGVPPRADWRRWQGQLDGDWAPVPVGHVPPRAGLLLVAQNREGLALQRIAAMQLALAPSGRLALALVRSAASQLSLSPVGRLNLSLARSG